LHTETCVLGDQMRVIVEKPQEAEAARFEHRRRLVQIEIELQIPVVR